MSNNKVAVIIPVREKEPFLVEVLRSVVSQSLIPTNIVIVFDLENSPSHLTTLDFERKFNPPIKFTYIKSSGRSAAKARNSGLDFVAKELCSEPDFVAFVDADDVWHPDKLKKQVEHYYKHPKKDRIGLIYCTYRVIDENGREHQTFGGTHGKSLLEQDQALERLFEIPQTHAFPIPSTSILTREAYTTVRFDEEFVGCEDLEFAISLAKKFNVTAVPEALLYYRRHNSNMSNDESHIRLHTAKVYSKHFEDFARSIYIEKGSRHTLAMELIIHSFPASKELRKFPLHTMISKDMSNLLFRTRLGSSMILYTLRHMPEFLLLMFNRKILRRSNWRTF